MLKLIFSPYYDGNCYAGNPAKNKCVIGTKYVGSLGLLDELELRAGLSRGETSPMQRAIAYCNAIREVLANNPNPKPFYKQSFENDPLGVAQQLLRWRDALCMAGWNKETNIPDTLSEDGKKRLKDLQAIEKYFDSIGIGERWQILLAEAKNRSILPADVSIEVNMKMELLPPVIRNVLEEIKNNGGNVSESQDVAEIETKTIGDFTSKFSLYEFPDQVDAYQWAATQAEITPDVYINEDNFTFNQVLKSVGKPLVDASVDGGATELSQLLKLGILLFRSPVNFDNLKSYLSIFRHPIDWETRNSLLYHFKKTGGFGDMVNNDGSITKIADTAKNYPDFWGMWEFGKGGQVDVDKVKSFCTQLLEWIETATIKAMAEKVLSPLSGTQVYAQLSQLQERTTLLLCVLDGRSGDISNDELDKLVTSICQGGSVNTDFARLGSCDILNDLKGLVVKGKVIMWMDCMRKPRPRYEYAFLNPADIKGLQAMGLLIPDASLEMQASDFAEKLAVSRAENIIALMPQRKDGDRTEENLLITELRALNTLAIGKPGLPRGVAISPTQADTQKVQHDVGKALLANIDKPIPDDLKEDPPKKDSFKFTFKPVGYQRDSESFSSLSELINQPFDYVLDYIYNMKDENEGNLSTVEGNVAHSVIEQIVAECKDSKGNVDTEKFLNICNDRQDLETRTDKAILDVGVQLLQPENEMECRTFKRIFIEKSVPVLVKIIKENNLEVVGSEVEYTSVLKDSADKKVFNFNAKIDFLLKRKKENSNDEYEYLIFDFKWTGNPKKRKEELEQCKELQLALYQKIAEDKLKPVVMRGYYLLKQAQLLTINDVLIHKPNDAIVIVGQKTKYDIFAQAVASYRERINNLKVGLIEEGEEMKGTEFEKTAFVGKYISNPNNYYLNNKLKKNSREPGMTTTAKESTYGKNTVLKGKIK